MIFYQVKLVLLVLIDVLVRQQNINDLERKSIQTSTNSNRLYFLTTHQFNVFYVIPEKLSL